MTTERIKESLSDFRDRGFGGAFIHPRPGLITDYLSEEWFGLWRFAQSCAEELGLCVHIYDENSFPSGFSGGHVLDARSDLRLHRLVCREGCDGLDGSPIGEFTHDERRIAIVLEETEQSGWYAGSSYVDLLNRESTETFINLTHVRYANEVKVTGLMAFTDEPAVMDYSRGALPWSQQIEEQFFRDHGYELQPHLPSLFTNVNEGSPKIRYDFQHTLTKLFQRNFVEPLAQGCERFGMHLAGHLHEHEWPCPRYQANTMLALSGFYVPGIDLLGFQIDLSDRSNHGRWLLTTLEATSIAAQFGRPMTMCEAFGGGGYQTTLHDLKRQSDYLLASGINLIVPHMSYETIAGARKYDWPQTISDHAPFWDDIAPLNAHQTRVSSILSQGSSTAKILVLHPTATGWLYWTPDSEAVGHHDELPPEIQDLRTVYSKFLRELADEYLEFHLGDEWILDRDGRVDAGLLTVGLHSYKAVVIPPGMHTIRSETILLLEQFSASGGQVFFAKEFPERLDGNPSLEPKRALQEFCLPLTSANCFPKDSCQIRGEDGQPVPPGLQVYRRRINDRFAFFIANPWSETFTGTIHFEADSLLEIDTISGESQQVSSTQALTLGPGEHRLWIESKSPLTRTPPSFTRAPLQVNSVRRVDPNALPIDACTLTVGGVDYQCQATIVQNRNLWREHGFPSDPWEWGVQFKRGFLDMKLPESPGFVATYTFSSDIECDVQICVERPWLYSITFNGVLASFGSEPFYDENMRLSAPLSCIRGLNEVSLTAKNLNIHHELAPIWVLGDFSVIDTCLKMQQVLELGEWGSQGLPHYASTLAYSGSFSLQRDQQVFAQIDGYGYSSVEVRLDGETSSCGWGHEQRLPLGIVSAGIHHLEVLVRGNLRNLIGPFGVEGLPGPWLWYEAANVSTEPVAQIEVSISAIDLLCST